MAHVASILTFDPDPNKVIPAVVNGAVNVAASAAKQSSVKRFVYTSSSSAITGPKPNVEFTISTDNWNEEAVEAAWKPPPYEAERAWPVYGASKTQVWRRNFLLSTPNCALKHVTSERIDLAVENSPSSTRNAQPGFM